ncbi:MAG: aldehyde-activating protein [Aestuariibacter sp.]
MHYSACCSCGEVTVQISLPNPIEAYEPRQCDCDFCMARGLAYLSDPNGLLTITSEKPLKALKQGSNQASFLQCLGCDQVVAVTCQYETELRGAASSRLFAKHYQLATSSPVSPKLLSAVDKRERWLTLWAKVKLIAGGSR